MKHKMRGEKNTPSMINSTNCVWPEHNLELRFIRLRKCFEFDIFNKSIIFLIIKEKKNLNRK